jgi:hypothetical protein
MFKIFNGIAVNREAIKKIIPVGIDPKDEKQYCKIILISDIDECGIIVEGTLDEVLDILK